MQAPKYMLSDFSQEIKLLLSPNSGTIWDVNSRPRVPRDKFSPWTKSFREDQITLKLSASFSDMSPEPETTICINNTETSLSTGPSVNFTQKWLVTTEPHATQSPSSELQSSTRRAKSEDPDHSSSGIIKSDFQFLEQLFVQVKKDTEIFSKPTDPTPSVNDHKYLNLIKSFPLFFIYNLSTFIIAQSIPLWITMNQQWIINESSNKESAMNLSSYESCRNQVGNQVVMNQIKSNNEYWIMFV